MTSDCVLHSISSFDCNISLDVSIEGGLFVY